MNVNIRNPNYQMLFLNDLPDKRVKQTFFDVIVPFRCAPTSYFDNCSVVQPSKLFIENIVGKRLPNVSDWFDKRYISNPEMRKISWRSVYDLSLNNFKIPD
jgi:hypothetical protein